MTEDQAAIFKAAVRILCNPHFQEQMRDSDEENTIQKAIEIAHTLLVEAKEMGVE